MQKYVKNEKRYRLIKIICLLAVYNKLKGTGRCLSTRILGYGSSVGFYVDGQSYPSQPLCPNYEAKQYIDSYRTLTTFRKDVNIDRYDYTEGYCLYVLEVDPYYSFNIKRKGHCRLEMKFAKPLPESVTLILYATFPEILHIDASRSVYVR